MKRLTQQQKNFVYAALPLGALLVGLVLGYLLAMWGVYELLSHVQINNLLVDLNETEMVETMMRYYEVNGGLP